MIHCMKFKPMDVWFLIDDDVFKFRKLSFGICPVCNKPVAVLTQFNTIKKCFEYVRKSGFESQGFVESFKKKKSFSASEINARKFKPVTYKWVYGINKIAKNKLKQYAKDFFGNAVLVKEI